MQKIILTSLLLFITSGGLTYAESESKMNPLTVDGNKPNVQQDEMIKMMQDSLSFEKEKRQLVNEVALEKLRSELKKLRGTTTSPVMPALTEAKPVRVEVSRPYVILVSKIGGLTRVLVSDGGNKYYLTDGERFSSNGKNYILTTDSSGKYYVKEHQQ
ncbi:hypothetical protein KAK45_003176 [Salmonella enterica]|nr:hypothetical protein [Salmonella enterica subsp. enterica]EHJ4202542.1 hypothetical protein [Salmonella enterica]EHS9570499.1 hypothetical protein [Salmonella enterica]EHS9572045.1 hypothetical protein [Salmonella enterica]